MIDKAAVFDLLQESSNGHTLQRGINWKGAFWITSGVPALVLFSIGAIASTVGNPSWCIWSISIFLGFIQSFSYAEIAGLYPNKSGGASVYGAIAWLPYSKFIAPISVWCNWFAWSPVLAIGSGLAAGYILTSLFPASALINHWQLTLVNLDYIKPGLSIRINAIFLLGAAILLAVFAIQHRGILKAARVQMILGIAALFPLLCIGVIPLLTGDVISQNFLPFLPLSHDSIGQPISGNWNKVGWSVMAGGLFIAAWSTYGFETSVCYTREFKNPKTDTFKAIFYSGLLCLLVFTLVPFAFQGALGLEGMLAPGISSGMGVASVMATMVGGGVVIQNTLIVMLIFALILSMMTAMAGSSRTLYQASVDGWFPKYLSHVNENGAPTYAMWTDLVFNLILLLMSDYLAVLAISNVGYIIFNFFNLQAGWIHRLDQPNLERPFRCPTWLLGLGAILGFVNIIIMGMGADVWGKGTLLHGLIFAALIIPIFTYRHYVTDGGKFPNNILNDRLSSAKPQAGIRPYLTLSLAAFMLIVSYYIFNK